MAGTFSIRNTVKECHHYYTVPEGNKHVAVVLSI
jgi:hypothetical protein